MNQRKTQHPFPNTTDMKSRHSSPTELRKTSDAGESVTHDDYRCFMCSRPVKECANADGRAEELRDVALYLCGDCAEKEKKAEGKIGEYTILKQLGKGGMTSVYRALHEPSRRLVALKVVLAELTSYEWVDAFFEREVAISQALVHPALVRLIDHGREGKTFYLAYEYLPGGNLHAYAFGKTSKVTKLCEKMCQVLEGLHHIHGTGIVHRDITPYNMLLTRDGRCKLGDFGLAKRIGDTEVTMKMGETQITGTLSFMAPEQVANFEGVQPPADVYSAGVCLYNLLTGKFPNRFPTIGEAVRAVLKEKSPKNPIDAFLEDSEHKGQILFEHWKAVRESIMREDRTPIQHYRNDIPSEIAGIIDKSVMRDEDKRFRSAQEMRDVLRICEQF